MIQWLKKLFLSFSSNNKDSEVLYTKFLLLKEEITKLKEDQQILIIFCRDTLLTKIKHIDTLNNNITSLDSQIVKINELINQHADAINALIENYKKHIMNPNAHNLELDDSYEGKKQRNDN